MLQSLLTMIKKYIKLKKFLFLLIGIGLFLNFNLPLFVFAEEITPTPNLIEEIVSEKPTTTPSTTPELTPTVEPAATETPILTPEPTPDSETTPTPEITPAPAQETTLALEPIIIEEESIETDSPPTSVGPGVVEGFGNKFEALDGGYFNLVLESEPEIYLRMESVPEMVVLKARALDEVHSADVSIFGFEAETTYHLYRDDYHNHQEIVSDTDRTIKFPINFETGKTSLIFIQPQPSTKYLKDNSTGGDCTTFGSWNPMTKTCTMTTDLTETIQVDNNYIVLDGNGHSLTGKNSGYGVFFPSSRTGVTIKNLTVKKFSYGVCFNYQNSNNIIVNNTLSQNTSAGLQIGTNSNNNLISGNQITDNVSYSNGHGIYIYNNENNTLSGNVMSGNKYNFLFSGSNENQHNHNIDKTNIVDGRKIYFLKNVSGQTYDSTTAADAGAIYCFNCTNITVKDLSFSKNGQGVYFYKTTGSVNVENITANENYHGIYIARTGTASPVIKNNSLNNNRYGIYLYDTDYTEVRDNLINNSYEAGIGLMNDNNYTSLINNTITNTSNTGISLNYSSYATMSGNQVSNSGTNFYMSDCYTESYCDHNIDATNLLNGKILYYFKNVSDQTYDNLPNPGAVYVFKSNNITVKNMTMDNVRAQYGVHLIKTNNSRVENITVSNNNYRTGIQLWYANNNTLNGNTLDKAGNDGIILAYSSNNLVENNLSKNNTRGFYLRNSSNNNQFNNNIASDNYNGFYISSSSYNTFTENNAIKNSYGFDHSYATYNTWDGNTAENNQRGGFDLYRSSNNILKNNISSNNMYGVEIYYNASNNEIYDNIFANNAGYNNQGVGVLIRPYSGTNNCHNNKIYRNNFIDNITQARIDPNSGSGNVFYLASPTGGNYWSDWAEADTNGDSFIDIPYNFTGGSDNLPRVCPAGSLNIDKTPPTTTAIFSGDGGSNGWYRSDVNVSLTAADFGSCGGSPSDVAKTEYSFDKTQWLTYTSPFVITNEDEKTIYYRSIDNAGNVEGSGQEVITLIDDKFSLPNGSLVDWNVARGNWSIYNQELRAIRQTTYPADAFASKGNLDWKDYITEIKFHPRNSSDWFVRLGIRYNGNPSPYTGGISRYAFQVSGTSQVINKCIEGTCYGQNYMTNYSLAGNTWHTIKIEAKGNKQRYYLNGNFYYEVTDSSLSNGSILLNAGYSGTGQIHFDDVLVTTIQPIPPSSDIKIDKNPPIITGSRTPSANDYNWNNEDVTIEFACQDEESGIDSCSPLTTVSSEGANQVVEGTAVDLAGNKSLFTISSINIDKTSPQITDIIIPQPNAYGWYNTDVTINYSCFDNLSGVLEQEKQILLETEGKNQSVILSCQDQAGNTVEKTLENINIDKTNPEISIISPTGKDYLLNQAVIADWNTKDSLSGIESVTASAVSGQLIDTSHPGLNTFTAEVTDYAGNTNSLSVNYYIVYRFSDVLSPINANGKSVFKFKQIIPVKFELFDANDNPVNNALAYLNIAKISNAVSGEEIEADSINKATDGNLFRYDSSAEQYIFNLNTKTMSSGTWVLKIYLNDERVEEVQISLR